MTNMKDRELIDTVQKLLGDHPNFALVRLDVSTGEVTLRIAEDNTGFTPEEIDHMRNNRKINAIKCVRERLNLGLADAKIKVEQYMNLKDIPF